MRFLCVCLSPAIDATVRLAVWPTDGCVIKNATDVFAPGGKTVNVARWLAKRGAAVACGGLLGEDNAAMFERELAKYGIEDRFVRIPGATRVNEMFVTPQGSFKVNRPAFPGVEREDLISQISDFKGFDVVVLSGSLPKDWSADTYRHLVGTAKAAGARVVLDASGKALVEGVKAHPDVIKPNAEECEALIGFVPKTPEDFKKANAMLKACCEYPIISDGGSGCWFDGAFVAAPKVEVLDTTAAGDTLLAEWCWQNRDQGLGNRDQGTGNRVQGIGNGDQGTGNREQAGRWAVAAGSAACMMPGGEPPDEELVARLASSVSRP